MKTNGLIVIGTCSKTLDPMNKTFSVPLYNRTSVRCSENVFIPLIIPLKSYS